MRSSWYEVFVVAVSLVEENSCCRIDVGVERFRWLICVRDAEPSAVGTV